MIINEVDIQNFFCYVDQNVFEFNKGLNIVSARNSGGKSHLFNAFYWTFFNQVYVDKKEDINKKEWKSANKVMTLPDHVVNRANIGDVLKTVIKIKLTAEFHENSEVKNDLVEYYFEKEVSFRKGNNEIIQISEPELHIWYIRDGETVYLDRGEYKWFLDSIFPVSIRKFMWFQGETVDELYDFGNPSTLAHAINEISYFPIYENMVAITERSKASINKKIETEVRKRSKFSKEQEELLSKIEISKKKIDSFKDKIVDAQNESVQLSESILKEEDKLKGLDRYSEIKTKLNKLDYEIKSVNDTIDRLSIEGKEKFISKWMLNKCDSLIKASSKNLEILNQEIKKFQKSENPVPITLPGPEYVQKMLDDHMCYICEREVEEGTDAYSALETRMQDFKNNQIQKTLADNYTEINRFRRNLLTELPAIAEEVHKHDDQIEKLLDKRKKLMTQRDNIFKESGVADASEVRIGSTNAEQILNKMRSLRDSKTVLERRVHSWEGDRRFEEGELHILMKRKEEIIQIDSSFGIIEVKAEKYIALINTVLNTLKNKAYTNLISEITYESNVLYSKYLGGKTQGEIEIDEGVRIVDKLTKKTLSNLNTAELTAQKLAVANAFLSLSEKKMNRSFPLIADAPTSQFDDENTLFLTENLADSFDQIIIMSKDYNTLKGSDRTSFISKAKVSKYYELNNDLIENNISESRSNRKTYINTIK